ncbi:MAG: hypothetical protein L3J96_04365 [Thermoplasmata archaeon]|nr:hypothetical protein [Thermoplasmata archaeon]
MGQAITVALLGAKETGKELGKKGTSSDITLYNSVRDGHALTAIEPTQFPEKFPPLLYAIAMADRGVLVIPGLSKEIAETVATIELWDRPVNVVLGPGVGAEELRRAFKGTGLAAAPMVPLDYPKLRAEVESWTVPPRDGPVKVRIDHAFPVKGVGAVALGVVQQGVLKAHDKLRLFPEEKTVEVRSIQVHDIDVREATTGERVGIAMKGVEADEISRGQTLAPEGALTVEPTLTGSSFVRSPYYRGKPGPGQQLNVMVGLQFVPAGITALDDGTIELSSDRPIAYSPGESIFLADLSVTSGPRIVGRATL